MPPWRGACLWRGTNLELHNCVETRSGAHLISYETSFPTSMNLSNQPYLSLGLQCVQFYLQNLVPTHRQFYLNNCTSYTASGQRSTTGVWWFKRQPSNQNVQLPPLLQVPYVIWQLSLSLSNCWVGYFNTTNEPTGSGIRCSTMKY